MPPLTSTGASPIFKADDVRHDVHAYKCSPTPVPSPQSFIGEFSRQLALVPLLVLRLGTLLGLIRIPQHILAMPTPFSGSDRGDEPDRGAHRITAFQRASAKPRICSSVRQILGTAHSSRHSLTYNNTGSERTAASCASATPAETTPNRASHTASAAAKRSAMGAFATCAAYDVALAIASFTASTVSLPHPAPNA